MFTCPVCHEKITVHADGTAACSCEFVNPGRAFPKAWKDGSVDLDTLRLSMKREHGGHREGAGKPSFYGKPMQRINVMLDPETIAFYKQHGNSLSEGIRNHWRGLTQDAPDYLKATAKSQSVNRKGKKSSPAKSG